MSPKLRAVLARVVLVGGAAGLVAFLASSAPRDQSIAIRLGSRQVARLTSVVTKAGDSDTEPTAGFSQDFPGASPRTVRHDFSAPNGTYIVVITFTDKGGDEGSGALPPIPSETSFERRVSLVGGELIVSPD